MHARTILAAALALAVLAGHAVAEERGAPARSPETSAQKIAWFGTWDEGLAEAKRTGRPILLVSAAPHCRNVSGIW